MQACDRCHERKVRCNKAQPCQRCTQAGIECNYTDRSKDRVYPQSHVDALEHRLSRLEARNKLLARELSSARARPRNPLSPSSPSRPTGTPASEIAAGTRPGDVIGEVSYLSINAAGERHYLGSASGVLLANFVKANVDVPAQSRPQSRSQSRTQSLFADHDEPAIADARRTVDISRDMPPELVARRLTLAYLDHDHLCYPVISPAAFLTVLDAMYSDQGYYANHRFEAFMFDMVLAIATATIHKFDWQILPSAESHHARAMLSVSDILQLGDLRSLQAVILLTQYRMSSSIQDNSASMWHLVGIGSRMAIELGLHSESTYPLKHSPTWDQSNPERDRLLNQEISRYCFWSIVGMDRIVSNILGRPLALRTEDIDTSLPASTNDEILLSGIPDPAVAESLRGSRTSIFAHITKYRLLCGKIMLAMHGKPLLDQTDADIRFQRQCLSTEVEEWWRGTEALGLDDESSRAEKTRSCFRSREWFEMIFHNAMLMIYRPSPRLDVARDTVALRHMFASAKQSIALYAQLHRARTLNHSWLTLQAVFMSGLSYIFAVSMHFRERRRRGGGGVHGLLDRDPSTIEVVNDTRACSNVLVAVSERWNSMRHCFEVFNRLSDAVLADVIKFESGPPPPSQNAPPHGSVIDGSPSSPASLLPIAAFIPNQTQQETWNAAFPSPTNAAGETFYSSPLAVDNEFRDSFDDLQQLYDQQQVDISVYQLSQAWFDSFGLISTSVDGIVQATDDGF